MADEVIRKLVGQVVYDTKPAIESLKRFEQWIDKVIAKSTKLENKLKNIKVGGVSVGQVAQRVSTATKGSSRMMLPVPYRDPMLAWSSDDSRWGIKPQRGKGSSRLRSIMTEDHRRIVESLKIEDAYAARISNKMLGIQRRTAKTARNTRDWSHSLFSVRNIMLAIFGSQLLRSLVETSNQIAAIEARLYAASDSANLAGKEFDWLRKQAKGLKLEISSAGDSYSLFLAATNEKFNIDQIHRMFESFMIMSRVQHVSAAQFENITYAIREMSNKGVIYSQDLIRQLGTHLPGAIQLAAKSMDMDTEKFRKAMEQNQIDVSQFLINFSEAIRNKFIGGLDKALHSSDAAIQSLQTSLWELREAADRSGFSAAIIKTSEKLQALVENKAVMVFAQGFGKLASILADHLGLVAGFLTIILSKGLLAIPVFGKFAQKMGVAVGAGAKFKFLGKGIFRLLGGWVGLAVALSMDILPKIFGWFVKIYNKNIGLRIIFSWIKDAFMGIADIVNNVFLTIDNNLKNAEIEIRRRFKWLFDAIDWLNIALIKLDEYFGAKKGKVTLNTIEQFARSQNMDFGESFKSLPERYVKEIRHQIDKLEINNIINGATDPNAVGRQAGKNVSNFFTRDYPNMGSQDLNNSGTW